MARLPFRSSSPPSLRRKTASASRWRTLAGVAVLGGVGVFLLPVFRPTLPSGLERHFAGHRDSFTRLRDMILEETTLESVGIDRVGGHWLFDGRWTTSRDRFESVSLEPMLAREGLAPARYQDYLALLDETRAYRVTRSGGRDGRRTVRVWLFPEADETRSAAPRIFYSQRPPEPVVDLEEARRAGGPSFARLGGGWYVEFRAP